MLDRSDQRPAVTQRCEFCETDFRRLSCEIAIPRQWLVESDKCGVLRTTWDEARRFPRFHYHTRAILHYCTTIPALPRPHQHHVVLTENVSRDGQCFLHTEELFPQERMSLTLRDGKLVEIEVVRCRKINDRCFEIGARLHPVSDEKEPC